MPDPVDTAATPKVYDLVDDDGNTARRTEADLGKALARGYHVVTPGEALTTAKQASQAAYFDTGAQKAKATLQGAVSGGSLGLIDVAQRVALSDKELEEKRLNLESNPGWNTAGNVAGTVALSALGGGAVTKLGEKLGGKLAGRVAAEAASNAIQGVGQGISNVAISDKPITKEIIAAELVKGGLYGAGLGAGGALLGAGAEATFNAASRGLNRASTAFQSKAAAEVAEATERAAEAGKLSEKATSVGGLDAPTAELFHSKLTTGMADVEDAAANAAKLHESPITPKDIVYSARTSRQLFEEAKDLVDPKLIGPELRAMKKAQQDLGKMFEGFNSGLERPDILDAGGLKTLADSPEKFPAAAKALDDWRQAASSINKKAGLSGEMNAAKFIEETPEQLQARLGSVGDAVDSFSESLPEKLHNKIQKALDKAVDEEDLAKLSKKLDKVESLLADSTSKLPEPYMKVVSPGKMEMLGEDATARMLVNDPHPRIAAVARGEVNPALTGEVAPAVDEVNKAAAAMNESWGLKSGSKLDQKAVNKFISLPPDQAVAAASAFSHYVDTLSGFASKFDSAAGAKAAAGKTSIDEALAYLKQSPAGIGTSATSTADLFTGMAGLPAGSVPPLSAHADDMLKLWLSSRMAKGGAGVVPKTAEATSKLRDILMGEVKSAAKGAAIGAATGAVTGRDPVAAAVGAFGGALSYKRLGVRLLKSVGGTAKLSQLAGAATARMARATEMLAKGATHSRLAAPTALSLLNSYHFGDEPKSGKNLQEAYQLRLQELSKIAGNPYGAHQKINDNLAEMRETNFQLADDVEMQAVDDAKYILDQAPKDGGNMNKLGKSTWRPSDADISKWANFFRALVDPAGVWERVVSGRVTPQECKALRERRPETFAELQRQMLDHLPEIQKNSSYEQQTRLTVFTGVPVSSLASKRNVDFVQQQFADRAGPDSKPVDLNAKAFQSNSNQLTETQKLSSGQ